MKYEKAKEVVIVWEFKNEYWEKFVIFFADTKALWTVLYITWDEFDWECVELFMVWARELVRVFATNKWYTGRFLFNREEALEIVKLVKEFNPDIIDWLMLPTK